MTLMRLKSPLTEAMDSFFANQANQPNQGSGPATNIFENDKGFVLELAVPGVSKEAIILEIEQQMLMISTETKEDNKEAEQTKKYSLKEFGYGNFKKSFKLPKSVDIEKISANCENGILVVDLPKKAEEPKIQRKISVS